MAEIRVQTIAKEALATGIIPQEFIRSDNEQPATTTVNGQAVNVPIIDLGDPDEDQLVRAISSASADRGIFQVVNHGIPDSIMENLKKVGREFFDLPREEKEAYAKQPGAKSVEGYGTALQKELEGKKAWVDHLFNVVWPPSRVDYRFWPENPSSYREANEEYASRIRVVASKLLRCLSLGLGLEARELTSIGGDGEIEYLLKINYYPPCPRPDVALGVVAHTDMSLLTLLLPNHVQGLQLFRGGGWYDVKWVSNALIIHIGDQTEIISNGKYKSVLHRSTVNKEEPRMSWAMFLSPPRERVIGPHPKLVDDDQNPAKYKSKKFGDYAYCKLNKIPQ